MRIAALALLGALVGLVPSIELSESPAMAGVLKNGVKPGDRRKMHIVRPPRPGTGRLIRRPGDRKAAPGRPVTTAQHTWFWEVFSPKASARGSHRWNTVLSHMANRRAEGKTIVSERALARILTDHRRHITAAARRHRISETLLLAVISVESAGKPRAVSPKGAQGLMQLIPATAKRFGVRDVFKADQNINGGAAYIDWLLREFDGDVVLALAGYNAGEGAVRKHLGVPPYKETRDYVVKVMDAVAAARVLCATPPATPRDACDWRDETL